MNNEELLQRFLTETGKHISGDFSEGDTKRIVTKALEWASERLSVELRGDACGVCAGTGKPVSGKPCICKGVGTLHAENLGLREYIHDLENTPSPRVADERQKRVLAWATENFGPTARNRDERAARLVEEAIEIAQVESVPAEVVARILARVYSRPIGELGREIGGVAITLDALAENAGYSVEAEANRELASVLAKDKAWWTNKHAEKVAAGTADLSATPPQDSATNGMGK